MAWHKIAVFAAVVAPFSALLASPPAIAAGDTSRISGPVVHENLAVYFIHGKSASGPVPLTLQEALAAGRVVVHETGNVNMLAIENTGTEEVFVQAGDIVKGGQQDRVLTISMLVPARSGRLDIAAYCVEQGRWSARGKEDVKRFASADKAMPSRDAKLAMLSPVKPRVAALSPSPAANVEGIQSRGRTIDPAVLTQRTGPSDTGSRQSEVWSSVSKAQRKLAENLGAPVAASQSASSLQLSLENDRLQSARKAFIAALSNSAGDDDIVGYVFAVGGKLNSGDVYASNALFRKMWGKQLEAAVTEAIAEKSSRSDSLPGADGVRAFMAAAEAGKAEQAKLLGEALVRETRESDTALMAETRRATGGAVHKAYVSR
jgi:hypothetical protein